MLESTRCCYILNRYGFREDFSKFSHKLMEAIDLQGVASFDPRDLICRIYEGLFVCLFDLILYVPSTIFHLNRDGSSWVEPVLSWDDCVLLKDHNAVTPVRLKPAAPLSRVKHSTTEPLRSLFMKGPLDISTY